MVTKWFNNFADLSTIRLQFELDAQLFHIASKRLLLSCPNALLPVVMAFVLKIVILDVISKPTSDSEVFKVTFCDKLNISNLSFAFSLKIFRVDF